MMSTLPISTSDLCPLTTRLLTKELTHAFGIADEQTYDSRAEQQVDPSPAAEAAPVEALVDASVAQAGSNAGGQNKRKAPEQQQSAGMPAASAGNTQQPAASSPQIANHPAAQTASIQAPSNSQQQAVSSISAGLHQAAAAVVGGQLRGFPAAYISPHTLLPYGQQAVAALPHLSGALPVAMYSPADISAVMALQQQQQQQLEEAEEMQARALKRPRLVWTPQLHKVFEEAVQKIGINKAVPKTIMQMMSVDGLTRENVASHLQKYRLSLRKGPDGEFISTVTEGTETSAADAANSAGGTSAGAAAAAAAAGGAVDAAEAAAGGSSEAAADSAGGAAGDAAGGVSSDAGTAAVAGSKAGEGTEAGSAVRPAAAAAGGGGGGEAGAAVADGGDAAQQPPGAAAVAAATAALAAAAAEGAEA